MWVAIGVLAATTIYQVDAAADAKAEARQQAIDDKAQALEAAQFADTEGEGIGQLGNINLSIDSTIDDDIRKSGKSNLQI